MTPSPLTQSIVEWLRDLPRITRADLVEEFGEGGVARSLSGRWLASSPLGLNNQALLSLTPQSYAHLGIRPPTWADAGRAARESVVLNNLRVRKGYVIVCARAASEALGPEIELPPRRYSLRGDEVVALCVPGRRTPLGSVLRNLADYHAECATRPALQALMRQGGRLRCEFVFTRLAAHKKDRFLAALRRGRSKDRELAARQLRPRATLIEIEV